MFDLLVATLASLVRWIRGVETTSIPTAKHHSKSEIHSFEEELSNGTFRALAEVVEGDLIIQWQLIDPVVSAFSWILVCFFVLCAGCFALGLLTIIPINIPACLVGMPFTFLLGRWPALLWRTSPRAVYSRQLTQ